MYMLQAWAFLDIGPQIGNTKSYLIYNLMDTFMQNISATSERCLLIICYKNHCKFSYHWPVHNKAKKVPLSKYSVGESYIIKWLLFHLELLRVINNIFKENFCFNKLFALLRVKLGAPAPESEAYQWAIETWFTWKVKKKDFI